MEEIRVFPDKEIVPTVTDLKRVLNDSFGWWQTISDYAIQKYPKAISEWNYPGKKYGWSFRIKDKKRAILYFLPKENSFRVAFVFGQKATDIILASNLPQLIKDELASAKVYAEGRGIRLEVKNEVDIDVIRALIDIKLNN